MKFDGKMIDIFQFFMVEIISTQVLLNIAKCNEFHMEVMQITVLPRLVRRRTIKLMSFLIEKRPLILSNFLSFLAFFSREALI